MDTWQPITESELQALLAKEVAALSRAHRARFMSIRVPTRQVPVADSPGEFVFVVAERDGYLLYWSDIEEGWELERPNSTGGIDTRGNNQFKLSHIMHQVFGNPDARSK